MKSHFRIISYITLLFLYCITFSKVMLAQQSSSETTREEFKISFSERIRIETFDNAVTLSRAAKAGSSYLRARTSLMGQWFPSEKFEFAVKLSNEFRNYFAPTTNTFHMNEVFIDQLYFKWNTKSFLDGVLTVGRQNINLGEGFVVMDSSPLDGSRSIYFNAVKYDWNISSNNTLTLWGTYNNNNDQLPVLNGNDIDAAFIGDGTWKLTEQNEAGGGLYYTGKMTDVNLQAYYIRKDYLKPETLLGQVKANVNTFGSRVNVSLSKSFSSTVEAAYQIGKYSDYNKNAYGGYAYFDYLPAFGKNILPKSFTVGAIYLSGDDPTTTDNEGWDPVFSRWPKWSESYIYTQIKEFSGRPAYWSNLFSLYATVKFDLDPQYNFVFDYHHMMAPQAGISSTFVGTGDTRGDLFIAKFYYKLSQNVTGHVIFEHFIPGDYYFDGANVSNWARLEVMYSL